ncbi:MAG TPA: hypothetical protein VF362_02825, partial [Demequinaceae bacterium]
GGASGDTGSGASGDTGSGASGATGSGATSGDASETRTHGDGGGTAEVDGPVGAGGGGGASGTTSVGGGKGLAPADGNPGRPEAPPALPRGAGMGSAGMGGAGMGGAGMDAPAGTGAKIEYGTATGGEAPVSGPKGASDSVGA